MSSETVEALAARSAALDDNLVVVRRELAKARQAQKDSKRRQWYLTDWLQHVILILYYLAGYRPGVAIHYLAASARKRKWPRKADEELRVLVEDAFLNVDLSLIHI